jgi:hypothetical protein
MAALFLFPRDFRAAKYIRHRIKTGALLSRWPHPQPPGELICRINENEGLADLNVKADATSTLLPPPTADNVQ